MRTIPLSQIPSQKVQVVLDDQNCTIGLRWMQRELYMDLDVGATPIVRGAVCVNRADVVQSSSAEFRGTLHFFDVEADEPPKWSELYNGRSGRWRLLYVSEDEELPEGLRY